MGESVVAGHVVGEGGEPVEFGEALGIAADCYVADVLEVQGGTFARLGFVREFGPEEVLVEDIGLVGWILSGVAGIEISFSIHFVLLPNTRNKELYCADWVLSVRVLRSSSNHNSLVGILDVVHEEETSR